MDTQFALMVKTKHTTVVFRMDPGDELDVAMPDPNSMSAQVMVTFAFDGNGVSVLMHDQEG